MLDQAVGITGNFALKPVTVHRHGHTIGVERRTRPPRRFRIERRRPDVGLRPVDVPLEDLAHLRAREVRLGVVVVPQRLALLGQHLDDTALHDEAPFRVEAVDLDLAPLVHGELLAQRKQLVVA